MKVKELIETLKHSDPEKDVEITPQQNDDSHQRIDDVKDEIRAVVIYSV